MKKTLLLFALCSVIINVSSCSFLSESSMKNLNYLTNRDENYLMERMEQIIGAFETGNKQKLKEQFSSQAQSDAVDLDDAIENLFSELGPNIVCWEPFLNSIYSEDQHSDGNQSTMLCAWTSLKTAKKEYTVLLLDYPEDTINPDNEGLFALLFFQESLNELDTSWWSWNEPGLHFPKTQLTETEAKKLVDERISQVVEALQNQDQPKFKNLFSVQALIEAKELDTSINNFLTLIGTNIDTWEYIPGSMKSWKNYSLVKYTAWVSLKNGSQEYVLMLVDYPISDFLYDERGLYGVWLFNTPYEDIDQNKINVSIPGVHMADK